ncbi:hypothetical protein AVEN_127331-1 [Araneus ventricosus]|uniref:Uncharacterized protein n=1 Tax=Araneus ventricosus TaxID=182803 RepID=A0A4Y2V4F7_ARAVE|nr:hypothetical protein AVEN_127331-1 [Araneus ventricosus]
MEKTVDQQDDNQEVQRSTDWPVQRDIVKWQPLLMHHLVANSANTRLFGSLCGDMGNLPTTLLLQREVRRLSRGNVLTRLFELRHEVHMFLRRPPFYVEL